MNPTGTNSISAPIKMLRQIFGYGLVVALAFSWGCASGGDAPEETAPAEDAAAEENFETSFLGHRSRVLEAESALTAFLGRFDPDR